MNQVEKAKLIQKTLNKLFPNPKIPLQHTSPYTLLIAVLLSARCTDERVNKVTPHLFAKAKTPKQMVKLSIPEIQSIIRTCGLSPQKAKAIWHLSKDLLEKHQGKVPQTFEELEELPGVGHKTASVVMAAAFHQPAFPVDTHIHRLAKRWGLSRGKNVKQIEEDLKKLFPKRTWAKTALQIIYCGRKYCPARGHKAATCPICTII
ncbi:MAG TPA: endonuclease III [Rhabdochlamydiaceae bacterium]|nr:endonuclease III [Rhabdochlamydiaceae bacterium]